MISTKGFEELDAVFSNLIKNVKPSELTMVGAEVVYGISQELVPVDEGELKESGEVRQSGDDALVEYGTDHAAAVEFGTSRMAAQPFMRPAIENTARITSEITKVLMRQIGESK